jgi:hypothetical protein
MMEKSITEFLSNDYKEFAMYVVEGRAIPSVIDGFKPSQRKIIHGSSLVWKTGSEKPLKVFQLSGFIANKCFYHHGSCLDYDTEIIKNDGSIIKIGEWCDNYPDLKIDLISYDEKKSKYVIGVGHSPRIGSVINEEYEIEMEDGSIFKCTGNHPFYTQRGWIKAEDLTEDDEIQSHDDKRLK